MSELYENIKVWVERLPDETIVGQTNSYSNCLVATFLGRELIPDDLTPRVSTFPDDVLQLTNDFDYIDTSGVLVTAARARELFAYDCSTEESERIFHE